jgi:hypothetical protein
MAKEKRFQEIAHEVDFEDARFALGPGSRIQLADEDWRWLRDCTAKDLLRAASFERERASALRREAEEAERFAEDEVRWANRLLEEDD